MINGNFGRSALIGIGAFIVTGLLACLASSASAISIQRPDFIGTIGGDPESEVRVKVRQRHGKPRSVRVEVRKLELFCEDGTTKRVKLGPRKAKVEPRGAFSNQFFFSGMFGDLYDGLGGELRSKRIVTGYVYVVDDVYDPAVAGRPDCSTRGFANWRADKVGGS